MQTTSGSVLLTAIALLVLASRPAEGASGPGPLDHAALPSPGTIERCGTPEPTPAEMRECRHTLEAGRAGLVMRGGTIRLALHVLTCGGYGDVSDAAVAEQIAELNRTFGPAELRFELASIERVDNCAWHGMTPESAVEHDAKQSLAVDPHHELNVYVVEPGLTLLGWSYLPMSAGPSDVLDGVVVHFRTLPGGRFQPFDLGRTMVHEVGHYLGLYHTFQNGCDGAGDEVDDTPAEETPATGCPEGRNTCPSPGDDPIHNYMDYSDDACTWEFTPGQIERMREIIAAYRSELLGGPIAATVPEGRGRSIGSSAMLRAPLAPTKAFATPSSVEFEGSVPNPACEKGTIRFALPRRGSFTLRLRDSSGRTLRVLAHGRFDAGAHEVAWSSASLKNGLYTIELATKGAAYRRVILVERAAERAVRSRKG